jgi:GT2 family glycosyltransferase
VEGEGRVSAVPDLAIVIPAYQAAHHLRRSLPAAVRASRGAPVVVVDSGSTDGTADVARSLGAEVIRLPERHGPAHNRNVGVERTAAEVVLFIDADCVAHPDTVDRVRRAFAEDPALVALTGSYDDDPPEGNFASLYMNLRHHHTHQHGQREDASFWAGCGAVRRAAFVQAGGFDAARFPSPQVEDIELATRMRPLGRLRLDPDLQVTHLKRWSLRSVVETDVLARAVPWSRLILQTGSVPADLNLRMSQRMAATLAPLVLAGPVLVAVALPLGRWEVAAGWGAAVGVSVCLNRGFVGFLARRRGAWLAARAYAFHQVHLTYSAATFALMALRHRLGLLR